jgi:hypothetical protein
MRIARIKCAAEPPRHVRVVQQRQHLHARALTELLSLKGLNRALIELLSLKGLKRALREL